ncbi:MAG: hypothetical protein L0191_19850 [Acidobacteria bacterium]|nr:hypothetical protein [Acidobacteriota bacterium]
MRQAERRTVIVMKRMTGRRGQGKGSASRSKEPDAAWLFLQNLVLVGLIQPRTDELKRFILASPPNGPKAS